MATQNIPVARHLRHQRLASFGSQHANLGWFASIGVALRKSDIPLYSQPFSATHFTSVLQLDLRSVLDAAVAVVSGCSSGSSARSAHRGLTGMVASSSTKQRMDF